MERVRDVLNFCNPAIFYDYKNIGIIELNQARKCILNNFHETIPVSRILKTLSIIDVVILKLKNNHIENVFENNDVLRSNILHMISFEKVVRDEANETNSEPGCSCSFFISNKRICVFINP